MKKVSILVPESSVMQAIADPQYLFTAVNHFLVAAGKPPLFDVELVGAKKEVQLNNGMFSVHTDRQIKEILRFYVNECTGFTESEIEELLFAGKNRAEVVNLKDSMKEAVKYKLMCELEKNFKTEYIYES